MAKEIPYKIYLEESEMPKYWYNVRADMKVKPAPLLNPETLKPMTAEELGVVFCDELVKQELDDNTREYPIPQEILDTVVENNRLDLDDVTKKIEETFWK